MPPGTMLAGFACAVAPTTSTQASALPSTRGNLSRRRIATIAQPELLHLHLQALPADLEQARGLGHVAAGLVERLHDQLAFDAGGLGADRVLERSRGLRRAVAVVIAVGVAAQPAGVDDDRHHARLVRRRAGH